MGNSPSPETGNQPADSSSPPGKLVDPTAPEQGAKATEYSQVASEFAEAALLSDQGYGTTQAIANFREERERRLGDGQTALSTEEQLNFDDWIDTKCVSAVFRGELTPAEATLASVDGAFPDWKAAARDSLANFAEQERIEVGEVDLLSLQQWFHQQRLAKYNYFSEFVREAPQAEVAEYSELSEQITRAIVDEEVISDVNYLRHELDEKRRGYFEEMTPAARHEHLSSDEQQQERVVLNPREQADFIDKVVMPYCEEAVANGLLNPAEAMVVVMNSGHPNQKEANVYFEQNAANITKLNKDETDQQRLKRFKDDLSVEIYNYFVRHDREGRGIVDDQPEEVEADPASIELELEDYKGRARGVMQSWEKTMKNNQGREVGLEDSEATLIALATLDEITQRFPEEFGRKVHYAHNVYKNGDMDTNSLGGDAFKKYLDSAYVVAQSRGCRDKAMIDKYVDELVALSVWTVESQTTFVTDTMVDGDYIPSDEMPKLPPGRQLELNAEAREQLEEFENAVTKTRRSYVMAAANAISRPVLSAVFGKRLKSGEPQRRSAESMDSRKLTEARESYLDALNQHGGVVAKLFELDKGISQEDRIALARLSIGQEARSLEIDLADELTKRAGGNKNRRIVAKLADDSNGGVLKAVGETPLARAYLDRKLPGSPVEHNGKLYSGSYLQAEQNLDAIGRLLGGDELPTYESTLKVSDDRISRQALDAKTGSSATSPRARARSSTRARVSAPSGRGSTR